MIEITAYIAMALFLLSIIIVLVRIVISSTLPDKVISFDLISFLLTGIIVAHIFIKDNTIFIDIIFMVTALFFIGTAVIAKYLTTKAKDD